MRRQEPTAGILGACFDVANELRPGFLESVHGKALLIVSPDRGLTAETKVRLAVRV